MTPANRDISPQFSEQMYEATRRAWGAVVQDDGRVRFRVWAPAADTIALRIDGTIRDLPMSALDDGWFEVVTSEATHGSRYKYVLSNGTCVADPASCYQPDDIFGSSEVIDPERFAWTDTDWHGRVWNEAVIYELHVGAFTPEGTFAGVADKLSYLASLGVTAIELMPVADFPGGRNWGYDGVFPYAPDSSYGRPEDLKALVDAAHTAGLMVFLDVVYNHFGPAGNFLGLFAPAFFTERHKTPWGAGINFDGPESSAVRRFFTDNALYWIHEFHFDGLRLDAVHAIQDNSKQHIVAEIAQTLRSLQSRRQIHLVLENEANEAHWLTHDDFDRPYNFTAQWNDDVHHALHTAATTERRGYYGDYYGDLAKLVRALSEGFAFQGEYMAHYGRNRGQPSAALPATAFISFIQNHDQVGNRAFGERLTELAAPEAVRAVAAIYLLLPHIPMLFMGEEWGATSPFPYFCEFEGKLGEAVRRGRREEFTDFMHAENGSGTSEIPDPLNVQTYRQAKLAWHEREQEPHRSTLAWYRSIIAVRATEIAPRLQNLLTNGATSEVLGTVFQIRWTFRNGDVLTLCANLSSTPAHCHLNSRTRVIWCEGNWEQPEIPAWAVLWTINHTLGCPP